MKNGKLIFVSVVIFLVLFVLFAPLMFVQPTTNCNPPHSQNYNGPTFGIRFCPPYYDSVTMYYFRIGGLLRNGSYVVQLTPKATTSIPEFYCVAAPDFGDCMPPVINYNGQVSLRFEQNASSVIHNVTMACTAPLITLTVPPYGPCGHIFHQWAGLQMIT